MSENMNSEFTKMIEKIFNRLMGDESELIYQKIETKLSWFRSFVMLFVYPIGVAVLSLLAIIDVSTVQNKDNQDWIAQNWGRFSLWCFGAKVNEVGLENIPKGSCLYVFNHSSYFDVFAIHASRPGVRFGAKIELFHIPLFGQAMEKIGVLPIARHNRQQAIDVYRKALPRVQEGQQFVLAPEGGRSESDQFLRPFKSGPFIFAIDAQIPIVPIVVRGACEIMGKQDLLPNADKFSRTITLEYLSPISTQEFRFENRHDLVQKTYQQMLPFFNKFPNEQGAGEYPA